MNDTDYSVQNALNFLGEQRVKDVIAWGYAIDMESVVHAIEVCMRSNPQRRVRWMMWCDDSQADTAEKP